MIETKARALWGLKWTITVPQLEDYYHHENSYQLECGSVRESLENSYNQGDSPTSKVHMQATSVMASCYNTTK